MAGGWVRVRVRAASPATAICVRCVASACRWTDADGLGTDAAGTTADGRLVIVHAVTASRDRPVDETLDPRRQVLPELLHGSLAEYVLAPEGNVIDKAPLVFPLRSWPRWPELVV